MPIRDVSISLVPVEDIDDNWKELQKGLHAIQNGTFAVFDFAEEVIGLLRYNGGCYEVGIGESLRGYERLYFGWSETEAEERFWQAVTLHTRNM